VNLERRFTIVAETGQGSMSRVYRATDNETGRSICLKVQDLAKTTAAAARSSKTNRPSEGAIGQRIVHPHVVRTFEHGMSTKGEHYIVMEFIDGLSFNYIRESRGLDLAGKIDLLAQAAEGLAAVHAAGFIHHDFGPKNLLVTRDDQVKLIDFGLAVPNTQAFHRPGNRTGTLNYMAPELLRRENTDQRLDVFSFGVTAYEFLTGKLPYDATNSMAMMLQRINHDPLDIAQAGPRLPEELCALIRKVMARNIRDRWPSMATLAASLRELPGISAVKLSTPVSDRAVADQREHAQSEDDFLDSLGVTPDAPTGSPPSIDADDDAFLDAIGVELSHAKAEAAQQETAASATGAQNTGIPKAIRHAVWVRDEGRCVECGSNEDLKFKHIIPIAKGGTETVENIRILCKPCRHAKRALSEGATPD
jgi:serine/threonine protein kinase